MIRKLILSIMVFSGVMLFGTSALADEEDDKMAQEMAAASFEALDVNGDGAIDEEEASADEMLARDFAVIANRGRLTVGEYTDWRLNIMSKEHSS